MCGIAGVYNFNKQTPDRLLLQNMGDAIAHRGPDHTGYYTNKQGIGFCHRRLSVIDLSDQGNQPMSNDDKSIWLVYNGEIYNYKELRKELKNKGYQFKSKTDSEVILKAYEEYGINCIKRFNGMFAFSLWDSKKNRFFAARDRIGIKPYYYHFCKNSFFAFASETKALLVHPGILKEPNDSAISNFLLFQHQIDNQTWLKNIYSLSPGSFLIIEDDKLQIEQYWSIEYNIDYTRSYNSFTDELREITVDSIKAHWQSDVPVGAHLSGGVDSSAIVSIASTQLNSNLHTFSSVFNVGKEFDERKEIGIVASQFKTSHHEITINYKDIIEKLSKIIYHLDEPVVGPAILPMYRISELVKKTGVTVVNGGQGVDEMFGGYKPYFSLAARNLLSKFNQVGFPYSELFYLPLYLQRGGTVNRFINRIKKPKNINNNWIKGHDVIDQRIEGHLQMQNEVKGLDAFEKSSYVSLRYYLPALLQQEDRLSMAWSIESRVPFLDSRLIDLSLKIPSWYKVRAGVSKAVFRDSLRGIVPDQILNNKIKRGYPTPISIWFSGELYNYMHKLLSGEMLAEKYINQGVLLSILDNQRKDPTKNISYPLWQALVLEIWLHNHFGKRFHSE
jgi:asparagine synthase (glutamine-hydrolysing)